MYYEDKMKYIFPLGLFIAMFLDGVLSKMWASWMFAPGSIAESRLIFLWIFMAVVFGNVDHIIAWSMVAGLFYDMFFTGIMGIFVFLLPLMILITQYIIKFFERSFIVVLLIYLIDITILTTLFYLVNSLIGQTSMTVVDFISLTLGKTLLYNIIWLVVLYIPLKKLFTE